MLCCVLCLTLSVGPLGVWAQCRASAQPALLVALGTECLYAGESSVCCVLIFTLSANVERGASAQPALLVALGTECLYAGEPSVCCLFKPAALDVQNMTKNEMVKQE